MIYGEFRPIICPGAIIYETKTSNPERYILFVVVVVVSNQIHTNKPTETKAYRLLLVFVT